MTTTASPSTPASLAAARQCGTTLQHLLYHHHHHPHQHPSAFTTHLRPPTD